MKKLLIASALILVGCGSKTVYITDTTKPLPDTVAPTTTQAQSTEDIYLDVITSEYPQLNAMGDAYLLELGDLICGSIDEGMTFFDFGLMVIDMGLDEYMMGYIGGAAIQAFCPWNDWFFAN